MCSLGLGLGLGLLCLAFPQHLIFAIALLCEAYSAFPLNHIFIGLVLRLGVGQGAVLGHSIVVALNLLLHLRLRHQLLDGLGGRHLSIRIGSEHRTRSFTPCWARCTRQRLQRCRRLLTRRLRMGVRGRARVMRGM